MSASPDPTALDGLWSLARSEHAGAATPSFIASRIELEIADGQYTVRFAGNVADRGTLALGASDGFLTVTLQGVAGTNAGRTIPAIYEFAGEELRICYGLDGDLPTAFATTRGSQLLLTSYRRKP